MKTLATVAKALAAGVVGAYAVYQIAQGVGSPGGEGITFDEWVNVVSTALVAGFAVWAVPNTPDQPAE